MSNISLLLFALVLVIGVALAGVGGVLSFFLVGFLVACGAYLAWRMLGSGVVVVGGGGRKRMTETCKPHSAYGAEETRWVRGEEVDAAAAVAPPQCTLPAGIWFEAFDLVNGDVVVTPPRDGIFMGASHRDSLSRSTLLTPYNVARAAFFTSGRVYAWTYLDCPEALYALRAAPKKGNAVELEPDDIIEWLRARLDGEPPHKVKISEYVKHLRTLGVEIVILQQRDEIARFHLLDMTTDVDRKKLRSSLISLTATDFESLDWSIYDATVGKEACTGLREVAGEVSIDLAAKKIGVSKARPGLMWASVAHVRSEITFHTHPMVRFQGSVAEPPSDGDLKFVLSKCALESMIWHFITAPEGTYILRPSEALAARFRVDMHGTTEDVLRAYSARACSGGVMACAGVALSLLHEAGFVAFFRPRPCGKLAEVPDLAPEVNMDRRNETRADKQVHMSLKGEDLAKADWSVAVAMSVAPTLASDSAWFRARCTAGVIQPLGGHFFGDPAVESSYPGALIPGPILVFFFPNGLPTRVPAAALAIAKERAGVWPWMAFLSPSQVTVFRSDDAGGVEIYGPSAVKNESR